MKASGILFLRMDASVGTNAAGDRVGVLLPVLERDPENYRVVTTRLLAKWHGPAALAFFDAHRGELRAGRPLLLELNRFQANEGELLANVTHCELAPVAPSWQHKHTAAMANHQEHAAP